jgi:hypothetical protein
MCLLWNARKETGNELYWRHVQKPHKWWGKVRILYFSPYFCFPLQPTKSSSPKPLLLGYRLWRPHDQNGWTDCRRSYRSVPDRQHCSWREVGLLQWLLSSHVAPFVVCVPVIVLISEGEIWREWLMASGRHQMETNRTATLFKVPPTHAKLATIAIDSTTAVRICRNLSDVPSTDRHLQAAISPHMYRSVGMYHIQQHSPDFISIWAEYNFLIWGSPVMVFALGRWRSVADRATDLPLHCRRRTKCRVFLIHGCPNFYGKGPHP